MEFDFNNEYDWEARDAQTKEFKKWHTQTSVAALVDGLPIEVARQMGRSVPRIEQKDPTKTQIVKSLFNTRKAGHTIGMLMAELRFGYEHPNHREKISKYARFLSLYEKTHLLPDPLNPTKRLNITRLIACSKK